MLSPKTIKYAGKTNLSFTDYNLLCDVAFENDNGEIATGLNRDLIYSESYDGRIRRAVGSKYTETFAPKITLIKEDYSDLTNSQQREILAWLTSKSSASYLDVYDGADDTSFVYSILGIVTEINTYKLSNNRTVGITFVFQSVSPFVFSDVKSETFNIPADTSNSTIQLTCNSDDAESLIYPKITIEEENIKYITVSSADTSFSHIFSDHYVPGTVLIRSSKYYWKKDSVTHNGESSDSSEITTTGVYLYNVTTDEEPTAIGGNSINEKVTLDGANKVISSDDSQRKTFGDYFSWKWFGLKSGTNTIKIYGTCVIKFEWREPIKIGELV